MRDLGRTLLVNAGQALIVVWAGWLLWLAISAAGPPAVCLLS
jgi:hypothetical protein